MQRIVCIDGENLLYGLRILLKTPQDGVAHRTLVEHCDFKGLFAELLADEPPTRILWFGAQVQVYADIPPLREKSEEAVRTQGMFVSLLKEQEIEFVMVGYLRARESVACEHCGHRTWHLAEKGVDVGMAVRMVTEADGKTEIVAVSADTDLLPAFAAAHERGARIMHIGYEDQPSNGLANAADSTRTITRDMLARHMAHQPVLAV